jgi:IclR family transcriptional regulator, KDG regulon repressor
MKGMRLFERLVQSDMPMGISALAADLGLQKSNVHRTLATLVKLGYAQQNAAGYYHPTRRIWEQGQKVIRRDPVRRAALAMMHALHQETGETVTLAVLDKNEVLYLHQITSARPIRPVSPIGHRVPAIYPASGKVLLAFQPDMEKRVRALCARQVRDAKKVNTTALLQELGTARKTGFAYSMSGWREGINSVAGIVIGPDEQPAASLSISGPAERMDKERMKELTDAVLNACTQVGDVLGA